VVNDFAFLSSGGGIGVSSSIMVPRKDRTRATVLSRRPIEALHADMVS
jgi:hypothetical protein